MRERFPVHLACVAAAVAVALLVAPSLASDIKGGQLAKGFYVMTQEDGKLRLGYTSGDGKFQVGSKRGDSPPVLEEVILPPWDETASTKPILVDADKSRPGNWFMHSDHGVSFICATALVGGSETEKYKGDSMESKVRSCYELTKNGVKSDESTSDPEGNDGEGTPAESYFCIINSHGKLRLAKYNSADNTYKFGFKASVSQDAVVEAAPASAEEKETEERVKEKKDGDKWKWIGVGSSGKAFDCGEEYKRDTEEAKLLSCMDAKGDKMLTKAADGSAPSAEDNLGVDTGLDSPVDGGKHFVLMKKKNADYYKLVLFDTVKDTYTIGKRGGDTSIRADLHTVPATEDFKSRSVKATEAQVDGEWLWKPEGKDELYKCAGDETGKYLRDTDDNKVMSCAEAHKFEKLENLNKGGKAVWYAVKKDGKYTLALERGGKWTVASGDTAVEQSDAPDNDDLVSLKQTSGGFFVSPSLPDKDFKCASGPIDSGAGEEDVISGCGELHEHDKEPGLGKVLDKPDVQSGSVPVEMSKKSHFVMMETKKGHKLALYNPKTDRFTFGNVNDADKSVQLIKVGNNEEVQSKTKNAVEKEVNGDWVWEVPETNSWYKCSGDAAGKYDRQSDQSKLMTCAYAASLAPEDHGDGSGDDRSGAGSGGEDGEDRENDGSGLAQCEHDGFDGDDAYDTCDMVVSNVCSYLCREPGCPHGRLFKYKGKCVEVACQGDEVFFALHASTCPASAPRHPPEDSVPEEKRELFTAMFDSLLCNAAFAHRKESAQAGHAKHCKDYIAEMKRRKKLLE